MVALSADEEWRKQRMQKEKETREEGQSGGGVCKSNVLD